MAESRDGRIGAMMGGVARSIGSEASDPRVLGERQALHAKSTRPPPKEPFAQVLARTASLRPADTQRRQPDAPPAAGTSSERRPASRRPARGKRTWRG